MSGKNTAVEAVVVAAAPQGGEGAPVAAPVVDHAAIIAAKDAEIAALAIEKENYRKGMLKAKGKLGDGHADGDDTEDEEARIARIVRATLLDTKEAQAEAEKKAATDAIIARNKELELALKNRAQVTSTAGGSNTEKPTVKTDSYFSNEQIAAFKARGWSDEKIEMAKKNMQRGTQVPVIV